MKNTTIINLFGGPGSGKSTICADLFAKLKWSGIDCEMSLEYAKEKVWEKSLDVLENQIYIFGKQYHNLFRLNGKVDIVITDSPILLSLIYDKNNCQNLNNLVMQEFNKFNNINFFVNRSKNYNPNGRMQTEEQAKEIDNKVKNFLNKQSINYEIIEGNLYARNIIHNILIKKGLVPEESGF